MGWYDSLGGKTERVNIQNVTGGSAAKNFGDAFASIGKVIIDNEVAKDRAKLTDLQVQNEQNKLDEFKDAKKQKKFDDAFSLDIKTLDPSVSSEATQNAVDALKSFHTPSAPAVALQEQETKAKATEFQINQDKKYLGDAWTLDATASKDSRQNATDALGEFYKPDISAKDKVVEHFKGLDNIAQVKFNDEAIEQSVSGGYKNMKEFTVAHPELVKNADGVTMAKIESFYGGKDKDAQAKADSDRTYDLNAKKLQHQISNDNKTLAIQAQKGSDGEKDTKIVDAINKTITAKYGKVDKNGFATPADDIATQKKAEWLGTRALVYASKGASASSALVRAEKDWNAKSKNPTPSTKNDDPLGIRK
jgi:hypothetical protein